MGEYLAINQMGGVHQNAARMLVDDAGPVNKSRTYENILVAARGHSVS